MSVPLTVLVYVVTPLMGSVIGAAAIVIAANTKRGADHLSELRREMAGLAREFGKHLRDHQHHNGGRY